MGDNNETLSCIRSKYAYYQLRCICLPTKIYYKSNFFFKLTRKKRKELSFCRNSDILIPISLHLNVGDLNISNLNHFRSNNDILKYQRFTPSG